MPQCHICQWNDRPPTAEKQAACLACAGPSDNLTNHGKVFVSFNSHGDGFGRGQTAAEVEASLQKIKAEVEAEVEPMRECCRQTALTLLSYMDGLTARELKLLVEVAHGSTLAEVAEAGILERDKRDTSGKKGPMTRAGVSAIWRKLLAKFPDLERVLSTGLTARQAESVRRREERKRLMKWKRTEDRRTDHAEAKA